MGSNPTLSANLMIRGSSGVERLLEAQRAAGSIPALGTKDKTIVGSFNGRTSGPDPGDVGSIPAPTANSINEEGVRLVEEAVLKTVGRNRLGGSIPSPSATGDWSKGKTAGFGPADRGSSP